MRFIWVNCVSSGAHLRANVVAASESALVDHGTIDHDALHQTSHIRHGGVAHGHDALAGDGAREAASAPSTLRFP